MTGYEVTPLCERIEGMQDPSQPLTPATILKLQAEGLITPAIGARSIGYSGKCPKGCLMILAPGSTPEGYLPSGCERRLGTLITGQASAA